MALASELATPPEMPTDGGSSPRRSHIRVTAVVALLALAGLVIWLVVDTLGDDDSGGSASATTTQTAALSEGGLATLAQAIGTPIYWAGPRADSMYELTQQGSNSYVRYLPEGVEAGDPGLLLTVGTYPVQGAYAVTSATQGPDTETIPLADGGIAVISDARPTSAYIAFPDADYQIEVFDEDPAVVRDLVERGTVQPVPPPAANVEPREPEAVTEDDLAQLAESLGHDIYWSGPRDGATYELTVSAEGNAFLRYLAKGVVVGDEAGALTVGTYPVVDAYDVTKRGAVAGKGVTRAVAGGGIAVRSRDQPNNAYLAYPGVNLQIEVYSPIAGEAWQLVRQGKIVPVG